MGFSVFYRKLNHLYSLAVRWFNYTMFWYGKRKIYIKSMFIYLNVSWGLSIITHIYYTSWCDDRIVLCYKYLKDPNLCMLLKYQVRIYRIESQDFTFSTPLYTFPVPYETPSPSCLNCDSGHRNPSEVS